MIAWVKWWTEGPCCCKPSLEVTDIMHFSFPGWLAWSPKVCVCVCVCVLESLQGGTQTDSQGDSIILGRLRWSCLMKVRIEFVVCNNQSAAAYQSSHRRLQQNNAGGSSVGHSLTQTLLFYIWTLWKEFQLITLKPPEEKCLAQAWTTD